MVDETCDLERAAGAAILIRLIGRLPRRVRIPLILSRLQGLPPATVALEVGLTEDEVVERVAGALLSLRNGVWAAGLDPVLKRRYAAKADALLARQGISRRPDGGWDVSTDVESTEPKV